MLPKPRGLGPMYGAQFKDAGIAAAYPHRPPYPDEVFAILAGLIADEPRAVLDIGCGTGDLARPLARLVERVDAVDFSAAMLEAGRRLPGGDAPNLRWIEGSVEEAPLEPPYALVTAGESLHWMDWAVVLPRLRDMLTPRGQLAIIERDGQMGPWDAEVGQFAVRYSTNRDFAPYDLVQELERRGLFQKRGERRTAPVAFTQPTEGFIEAFHSRNGFSRDRMAPEQAAAFDAEVAAFLAERCPNGVVTLQIAGVVVWGAPCGD
jgi:SAM-dependent methyltransferase